MCRCNGATVSVDRMIEMFARVPVKARVGIRHMFAWPDQPGLAAYTFGPDIGLTNKLQNGEGKNDMNAILHETGHALDEGASSSKEFIAAIEADDCVTSDYSTTSRGECLGELMVWTYFKKMNPREYEKAFNGTGMSCMKNQLDYMESTFGARVTPGGTCPPRVYPDSTPEHIPGGVLKQDINALYEPLSSNWTRHEDFHLSGGY